jgi:hypothetical protein
MKKSPSLKRSLKMGRRRKEAVVKQHIRMPVTLAARIELLVSADDGSTIYGALSNFHEKAAIYYLDAINAGKVDLNELTPDY